MLSLLLANQSCCWQTWQVWFWVALTQRVLPFLANPRAWCRWSSAVPVPVLPRGCGPSAEHPAAGSAGPGELSTAPRAQRPRRGEHTHQLWAEAAGFGKVKHQDKGPGEHRHPVMYLRLLHLFFEVSPQEVFKYQKLCCCNQNTCCGCGREDRGSLQTDLLFSPPASPLSRGERRGVQGCLFSFCNSFLSDGAFQSLWSQLHTCCDRAPPRCLSLSPGVLLSASNCARHGRPSTAHCL